MNEVQVAFGSWVNANVPPGEAVLVNDAGAIRYFGRRRTIDLLGLNNHELLFRKDRRLRLTYDAAEVANYMSANNSTRLIIFPSWFPVLVSGANFTSRFGVAAEFHSRNYTVAGGTAQARMKAFRLIP